MSYAKMMKWDKKHPKGTNQVCIMHTDNGFTPSSSFLNKYIAYRQESEVMGRDPVGCEEYYNLSNRDRRKLLLNEKQKAKVCDATGA